MNFLRFDNLTLFRQINFRILANFEHSRTLLALTMRNFQKRVIFTTHGMESAPTDQMTRFFNCIFVFFCSIVQQSVFFQFWLISG